MDASVAVVVVPVPDTFALEPQPAMNPVIPSSSAAAIDLSPGTDGRQTRRAKVEFMRYFRVTVE